MTKLERLKLCKTLLDLAIEQAEAYKKNDNRNTRENNPTEIKRKLTLIRGELLAITKDKSFSWDWNE